MRPSEGSHHVERTTFACSRIAPLHNGLSVMFLDFDFLPNLLTGIDSTTDRSQIADDRAQWLGAVEFQQCHVDPADLPKGMTVSGQLAVDAWRLPNG